MPKPRVPRCRLNAFLTPSFLTAIMITTRDEQMAHDDFPFAFSLTCLFVKKKIDPRY
jgi:hypothetical protein